MPRVPPATEDLAETFLAASDAPLVKARDLALFMQSPFAVWCERFAPRSARDPLDAFQEMLFEQGRDHESRTLAALHPDARRVSAASDEDAFRLAVGSMAEGVRAMRGATLFDRPGGLMGRVDLLERRDDAPSRFGDWHYTVTEIKLAKNIKDHHRIQAAFYNHLVGKIQGFTPATFTIVNRDGEATAYDHDEPELLAALAAVRAIQEGRVKPPAVYNGCAWPWSSFTDRTAVEARDVSLLQGVGPARREAYAAAGIVTLDDVLRVGEDGLASIKGVGEKTAAKLARCARVIEEGRHVVLEKVVFPDVGTEVFLDLEGTAAQVSADGLVEMDYLIGALVRTGGEESYEAFVAHGLDEEGAMFRRFVAWLDTLDDFVLYHWHSYEKTHLRKLAQRHGIAPALHAKLFAHLRDLHGDATRACVFPTYSTSIKAIAPYAGFRWRHEDVGAMTSIARYFEYVEDPETNRDALQKVLDYNEDDCIAMRVVKDWLVENAS